MVEMINKKLVEEHKEELQNVGKVVILGASGLVASRFIEMFGQNNILMPTINELDITNQSAVKEYFGYEKPTFIVNFIAETNVNEGEKQRIKTDDGDKIDKNGSCWQINVEGVRNILDSIDPEKTHFIQISTDMVLSGSIEDPGPYKEDHLAETDINKLTVYGATKGEAERLILKKLGNKATIVRIIYPVKAKNDSSTNGKLDYLHGPLAKFDKGELKTMFADQQISITFIDELCVALAKIIERKKHGIFHIASRDTGMPSLIVNYLIAKARGVKNAVQKSYLEDLIKAETIPVYRYPMFGGLDVYKTEQELGMKFSSLREIVDEIIKQGIS